MSLEIKCAGLVGLGRMGWRLALRLSELGIKLTGYDIEPKNGAALANSGISIAENLATLVKRLPTPRLVLVMLPAGEPTNSTVNELSSLLESGDTIFEMGNSFYKDSQQLAQKLSALGIELLDVGVSGGVSGARNGPMLSVGGTPEQFQKWELFFSRLAGENGCVHAGPTGWGHLTKTIHNGIEYGFLQAIAEGLNTLKAASDRSGMSVDLKSICQAWSQGSIIESRLIKDGASALELLEKRDISGVVGGGQTGNWAADIARENGVEVPVLDAALAFRRASRNHPGFTGQVIAAIRNVFGEHGV